MKVLIVEPVSSGHHSFYLRLILRAFASHECCLLTTTVAPEYEDLQPVPAEALQAQSTNVSAELPNPAPVRRIEMNSDRPGPASAAAAELIQREPFDLVFVPFIDLILPHLARGRFEKQTGGRTRVAGIWMGPNALDRRYRFAPPIAKRPRTYGRVHRWLRRPETARCLSDLIFLVQRDFDQLARVAPSIRGHLLHDPPETVSNLTRAQARLRLGLPADAPILLHAGSAGRRKGLGVLLDAYARLESRGLVGPFLYRVGPNDLKGEHREQLERMINAGQAAAVHRYVPTADLVDAFAACDWVAMPYRKFRHSSGILGLARVANRPVLAPDYGHIAQQVRTGQPGRLYRHGSTKDLARVVATLEAEDTSSASMTETEAAAHAVRSVEAEHHAFIANLSGWIGRIEQEESR